jgi:ribonuclease P protein component
MPNDLTHGRLGLVVSRKVGRAVRRNRLKRVIREVFRLNKPAFAGLDVVVIPRGKDGPEDFATIAASLLTSITTIRSRIARRQGRVERKA